MNRKWLIISIMIIAAIVICNFIVYKIGYSAGMSKGYSTGMSIGYSASLTKKHSIPIPELFDDSYVGRYDYPLMEDYFDDNYKYTFVIKELSSDNDIYRIISGAEILDSYRAKIAVLTFPGGKGITPSGSVYLYKNHTLVKEVPFFEVYIAKTIPNEDIQFVTYDKVKQLIGGELPSMF
jgi:hypothetical protein